MCLYNERQQKSVPILDEFKKWLDVKVEQAPPKSLLCAVAVDLIFLDFVIQKLP